MGVWRLWGAMRAVIKGQEDNPLIVIPGPGHLMRGQWPSNNAQCR